MYDKNTLHRRKFSFVLDHGEGGAYKVPGKSTNEGKTNTLILNAWGKWKKSSVGALSILSDALHQAEDRGAHGEGDPFKGHDIRKTLYKREWETNYDTTEPDNVSQNSEGATLALGYAENVLSKFKEAVHLPPGKKIGISRIKEFFKKRRRVRAWGKHTHYLPLWAKSSDPISHMVGQTGLGRKDGLKKLRAIITRTTKDPAMKAAYERARDPRQKKEILNLELRNVVQNPEQNPELIKQLEEVLKKQRR